LELLENLQASIGSGFYAPLHLAKTKVLQAMGRQAEADL
jgi:hypothetical protein